MTNTKKNLTGLTHDEVAKRQQQYGKNELTPQKKNSLIKSILHTLCEPMFLLLIVAAVIYFVLGEPRDGAIMLIFVVGIISIDVIQEWKTDKTLNALKDLSAPQITVIRDGKEQTIASAELVPGDLMLICEGVKIPADGVILRCADLCVDESSLTGEAEGVWKTSAENAEPSGDYWRRDYCYAGTLVTQGSARKRYYTGGENRSLYRVRQDWNGGCVCSCGRYAASEANRKAGKNLCHHCGNPVCSCGRVYMAQYSGSRIYGSLD